MVTATGTSRSSVVHTVPAVPVCANQHTPEIGQIWSVGAGWASAAPHCTVTAGSPNAAFCSGALTCRSGRLRSFVGNWAMNARQAWACAGDSFGAGIVKVPGDVAAATVGDAVGVALSVRDARYPNEIAATRSATGTATSDAITAARRVERSAMVLRVHRSAQRRPTGSPLSTSAFG